MWKDVDKGASSLVFLHGDPTDSPLDVAIVLLLYDTSSLSITL